MFGQCASAIGAVEMRWKAKSLRSFSVPCVEGPPLNLVIDTQSYILPRTPTLSPLGVLLDNTADTHSTVQERLVKAGKTFWAMGDFLRASHVPLRERWDTFAAKVAPVALYSSDLWVMGQKTFDLVMAWETAFLRRMLGFRRKAEETWLCFQQRSGKAAIQLYTKAGHQLLVVRWAKSVICWREVWCLGEENLICWKAVNISSKQFSGGAMPGGRLFPIGDRGVRQTLAKRATVFCTTVMLRALADPGKVFCARCLAAIGGRMVKIALHGLQSGQNFWEALV